MRNSVAKWDLHPSDLAGVDSDHGFILPLLRLLVGAWAESEPGAAGGATSTPPLGARCGAAITSVVGRRRIGRPAPRFRKRAIQRGMSRPCELEKTARSQSNRPTGDAEWHARRGAIGPLDGEAEDPAAWTLDDDVAPTMQVIALGAQHGELGPE